MMPLRNPLASADEQPATQLPDAPQSRVARRGKGELRRADGRVTRRMTMYLSPELAQRVVLRCAETGREISDVAAEALERYLGAQPATHSPSTAPGPSATQVPEHPAPLPDPFVD